MKKHILKITSILFTAVLAFQMTGCTKMFEDKVSVPEFESSIKIKIPELDEPIVFEITKAEDATLFSANYSVPVIPGATYVWHVEGESYSDRQNVFTVNYGEYLTKTTELYVTAKVGKQSYSVRTSFKGLAQEIPLSDLGLKRVQKVETVENDTLVKGKEKNGMFRIVPCAVSSTETLTITENKDKIAVLEVTTDATGNVSKKTVKTKNKNFGEIIDITTENMQNAVISQLNNDKTGILTADLDTTTNKSIKITPKSEGETILRVYGKVSEEKKVPVENPAEGEPTETTETVTKDVAYTVTITVDEFGDSKCDVQEAYIAYYRTDVDYATVNELGVRVVKPGETLYRLTGVTSPTHYTLKDWYADKECTELFDFEQIVDKNTTLYADFFYSISTTTELTDFLYGASNTHTEAKMVTDIKYTSTSSVEVGKSSNRIEKTLDMNGHSITIENSYGKRFGALNISYAPCFTLKNGYIYGRLSQSRRDTEVILDNVRFYIYDMGLSDVVLYLNGIAKITNTSVTVDAYNFRGTGVTVSGSAKVSDMNINISINTYDYSAEDYPSYSTNGISNNGIIEKLSGSISVNKRHSYFSSLSSSDQHNSITNYGLYNTGTINNITGLRVNSNASTVVPKSYVYLYGLYNSGKIGTIDSSSYFRTYTYFGRTSYYNSNDVLVTVEGTFYSGSIRPFYTTGTIDTVEAPTNYYGYTAGYEQVGATGTQAIYSTNYITNVGKSKITNNYGVFGPAIQ